MTLALEGVSRSCGGRLVLDSVSLSVKAGTVHALVGENGAGKTSLIRIACGLVASETGAVKVDANTLAAGNARDASRHGVGVVHQHFMLIDTMTVAENVALGAEPTRGPGGIVVDHESVRRSVRELAQRYGLPVDPDARIETLSVGQRQRVELIKVLYRGARYVLLDEPTAVLSPNEIDGLLDMIRGLTAAGAGVLFVSHKLAEVMAVADEITVLRRGKMVLRAARNEVDASAIARAVVGGEVPHEERAAAPPREGNGLAIEALQGEGLRSISLRVAPGEVVGVVGVEGNGQRQLAQSIAGLNRAQNGSVRIGDDDITRSSVDARRKRGLGYVPEDREGSGLLPNLSIAENLALGDPGFATRVFGFLSRSTTQRARAAIERYEIRPAEPDAAVGTLSGGNAQKVLIARELSRELRALVVAQPTRGIDLGAAVQVHRAILAARERGVATLLVSSDLEEIRLLADRVVVMRSGAIVAEMPVAEATDARLGPLMVGEGT